jgi:hypothetical protein
MTPVEHDILAALRELNRQAAAMKTAQPKPDLQPLFQRLDDLATRLPADADRQLLHFLHNKSYEKARLWLEGRPSEIGRGSCGR